MFEPTITLNTVILTDHHFGTYGIEMSIRNQERFAISAAIMWGINYPIVKSVLKTIPENHFLLIRFSVSVAILSTLLYFRKENLKIARKHIPQFMILGILGVGVYNVIWTAGIHMTTVANAALLISTSPIFTGLYSILAGTERFHKMRFLGILLAFIGVYIIITWSSGAQFSVGKNAMIGNLLMLSGSMLFALYAVMARPLLNEYSPVQVTTVAMAFGLPVMVPYGLGGDFIATIGHVGVKVWLELAFVILIGTSLAYVFWYKGIKQLGPTRTVIFHYLVSVISMVTGKLLLAEMITRGQVIGALLVLSGLLLSQ